MKSFPQTLSDVFILLNNWKNNPRNLQRSNMNEGVAFGRNTTSHATSAMKLVIVLVSVQRILTRASSSSTMQKATIKKINIMMMRMNVVTTNSPTCYISNPKNVSINWILLDNQSNVDAFQNRRLLINIRDSRKTMKTDCNAGIASTSLVGDLHGYGEVWYHPGVIANIYHYQG